MKFTVHKINKETPEMESFPRKTLGLGLQI